MLGKKAATQNTLKEQYDKLAQRLAKNVADADKLASAANMPPIHGVPEEELKQDLLAQCADTKFWENFKRAAPIMFCQAIEHDSNLKQIRDMSFIDTLFQTKSILNYMKNKIEKGDADVDIVEYSLATKMLETKLQILHALNIQVNEDDQNKIVLNIQGSNKAIQIDLEKLKEAVTIIDTQVEEKEGKVQKTPELENIDTENTTEEKFLKLAAEKIGPVQKTKNKTIAKDSFIKIFKYTGDLAKIRSKEVKKQAQLRRAEVFGKDAKKYLEALKQSVEEEENTYEQSSQLMFDALSISKEQFERSQQELMMDPYASMELFNIGITMEQPGGTPPAELTKERTVQLVKASNDFAFDLFKREYISQMGSDPMMMPVLISAIAHDWVFKEHGFTEEQFKNALFTHKIYEDPEIAMHMHQKQMELMNSMGMMNPMMMGMGGMPPGAMGGGMDPYGGMGGGMGGMGLPGMFGPPGGL